MSADGGELPHRVEHMIQFVPSLQGMLQKLDRKLGDLATRIADGRFTPNELDNLATLAAGCVDACETMKARAGELAAWELDRLDELEQRTRDGD